MNRLQPLKIGGSMERAGLSRLHPRKGRRSPVFFSNATYKITGVTKDSTGAALPNCIVNLFYSLDDTKAATIESSSVGEFTFWVTPNLFFYIVAYKAGAPDVAGTTVNTLVATLSGETPNYEPDAQEYFNRVAAAGGFISLTTKDAISTFVVSAKANAYWTKINRINLFVGDFTACFIPLKVGAGSAIDANNNFVAGDLSESTGLTGNGTTKFINTGLLASALTTNSTHIGVYNRSSATAGSPADGAQAAGGSETIVLFAPWSDSKVYSNQYDDAGGALATASTISTPYGFIIGTRTASDSHKTYRNGVEIATSATSGGTLPAFAIYIFANNVAGTPLNLHSYSYGCYTIGDGLTAGNNLDFNTDIQTFMSAIGRAV